MTEVLFYHLQGQKLEGVLPGLLEKSLQRGWKVVVQGASEERIEALDAHLWTYRDDGFLPHGTWREQDAAQQPILLTLTDSNPNAANVRFLIEGAAAAGRRRGLSAHRAAVRRRGRRGGRRRPRAVERGQGQRLRRHLLAADEQGRWVKKA